MAQFVRDTMTGTGYTNLALNFPDYVRSGEVGATWYRNPATPSTRWYLYDNRAHCGDGEGAVYANGSPASTDYYVECDYIIYSDILGAGICVRMSTTDLTAYATRYEYGKYILIKFSAGNYTELASYAVGSQIGTHKLRLTVSGTSTTSLVVAVDGVNRITYSDTTSPITAAGKAGLASAGRNDVGSGKHIDNFVAVDGAAAGGARSYALGIIG